MTSSRQSRIRSLAPIAILILAVGCTLVLLYSRPVRNAILDPILSALNEIRNTLALLPQSILWAAGIFLGTIILAIAGQRMLERPSGKRRRSAPPSVAPYNTHAVDSLSRSLARSVKRHVSRVRIVRELAVLAVRLIARKEGCSLPEARKLLNSGYWTDDPVVRRFFALRDRGKPGRQDFSNAVEHTLKYLEQYHQEV